MVMDANGMGHKPAGTVGGGQFENKVGAGMDDDLDLPIDDATLSALREGILRDLRAEIERVNREGADAYQNARVGRYLHFPRVRDDIASNIARKGAVSIRFPGWRGAEASRWAYRVNHLDSTLDPHQLVREWGRRGVDVTFDGDTVLFKAKGAGYVEPVREEGGADTRDFVLSQWYDLPDETREHIEEQIQQGYQGVQQLKSRLVGLTESEKQSIRETVRKNGEAVLPLPEPVDPQSVDSMSEYDLENQALDEQQYTYMDENGIYIPPRVWRRMTSSSDRRNT